MTDPIWAGGSLVTWGDGRPQKLDSWGHPIPDIPIMDPGVPLTDLGLALKNNPRRVWKEQPSLRKVVSFVAANIGSVPLHVYTREDDGGRERARDAERVLLNPSPLVTGSKLIHDLVVDLMLYDRYLVLLLADAEGTQVLRRVPAGLIEVKTDFLGGITGLYVRAPGGLVDVTDLVVAYDEGWAGDEGGGVSHLHTLANTLEEQRRAVKWRSEQWAKAARINGVLTSPDRMHDVNRDRLVEDWRRFVKTDAGGTPLLDNGVKFEPINSPRPVDQQDLAGRQLTDAEVASYYQVPPELVGARPGTFANVKAFREMLYGPVLGPRMTRLEQAFNARIIPHLAPEGAYAEFPREAAMAGSFVEQATTLSRAVGGPWMTRSEARERANLPHIDEADELIVPLNVTTGGLASPADTGGEADPYETEKAWTTPPPKGEEVESWIQSELTEPAT